ncbi:MAG: apolipoprotein N-acyltransferase [Treponemataceae bacterium]|nr:apolipoprotein N-acyltransferase [Treponemataceae bacterium]
MEQPVTVKGFLKHLGLLVLAVFLFALPHPTDLFLPGLPFLSYFAIIPVFLLVAEVRFAWVWVYGFLYGLLGYCLYVSWLATFNPAAMPVIALMYGFYLMACFPLMKLAGNLFPKYRFFAQWIVWCAYEYVKTLGFNGFNYGVTAYSQWRYTVIIQCVAFAGVFGLNMVITWPSAWFAAVIKDSAGNWLQKVKNHRYSGIAWICVFAAVIVYGLVSPVDYSRNETVPLAVLQTNSDPWVGGFASYQRDLDTLIRLSDEALEERPDLQFVVWPETAFIPRITWHYQRREERDKFELIEKLLTYINSKNSGFIIGNDDGTMGYNFEGRYTQLDYNAVLVFTPGENVIPPKPEVYHKIHLVPFTEWFPYKKQLPVVYKMLEENDTHFWDPGSEPVIFRKGNFSFATPICFEDTFGSMGRLFVSNGARAFVNLSNDAWAGSEACQKQHLAMALFRCVENRVPAVRSTASGQTVFIDPNGVIKQEAEPFCETYLCADVPVMPASYQTLYTRFGDWAGVVAVIASLAVYAAGFLLYLKNKRSQKGR